MHLTTALRGPLTSALASLLLTVTAAANAAHPGDADSAFGSMGHATYDFFSGDDDIRVLAPLPDGRFLALGSVVGPNASGSGSSVNVGIARYLPNGNPDVTFGTNGLVNFDLLAGTDEARAVKLVAGRRILVGATLSPGAYSDFGVMRLLPNGTLDYSFGMVDGVTGRKGYNRLDIGGTTVHDEVRALAVQSTGKIVVAGITRVPAGGSTYRRVAVARFTADGLLDTTFGGNNTGYVVLPSFATDPINGDELGGIALTQSGSLASDDSITLVGNTELRANNAFVARLTADGAFDTRFGGVAGAARTGSTVVHATSSGGVSTGLWSIASGRLADDGKVIVVGTSNDRGYTFLRFTNDGTPDATFGTNGRTQVKYSDITQYDEPSALALQGNGKIVAAGYASSTATGSAQRDFCVVRLSANGIPDPGFGDGAGRAVISVNATADESYAAAIEPSGKILAGGYAVKLNGSTQRHDFALLRVFGDPDRIFYDDFEGQP